MLITQIIYTLYILALLRYQNIRYYLSIVFGNIFMLAIILIIYLANIYGLGT